MSPLKRRQFGQLAAASLTSTVVVGLSSKTLAQSTASNGETLYGVKNPNSSSARDRENQSPLVELNTVEQSTGNVLSKTNAPALSVEDTSPAPKKSKAISLPETDRITKLAALGDGNLVISTVSYTKDAYFNHLIFTVGSAKNPTFKSKKVLGLADSDKTVESLLSLSKNQLLCLVGNQGIPPFFFGIIDSTTGKISSGDSLDLPPLMSGKRYSNLCQDAKGNIFATETSSEGIPILISINLQEKATITGKVKIKRLTPLSFEGSPLVNDVKDLNFSSSNQLYALAKDNSGKNTLFTVDVNNGKLAKVTNLEVDKFAFSS
ncbi:hypothetical protein G7B40_029890 [Aetokthonos hydrillicola Thurmond2011]|uniref:Uncharacterized protein n=1 Tax=Aetokthonos hydrillicola Thurmond2011 TaxID=2712845 RepID=A0AAP5ICN1_9CYAN|nr:hypothetical protein [Aetokthonos hydrillicola]MBW4589179.1 hypothetical protein [Aetokthonos hydrillicola CCALA 1050]MDR9898739.1 hypothetical protein [Aetokthonos hydrillicola Thurmond2011]